MQEKAFEFSEVKRILNNLFHWGVVVELDSSGTRYRVRVRESIETGFLPCFSGPSSKDIVHFPLSIGDQVMIVCPNGDFEQGVILGSVAKKGIDTLAETIKISSEDGTSITLNKKEKVLDITLGSDSRLNINSSKVVKIKGDLELDGSLSVKATKLTGDLEVNGSIKSTGDIETQGVSLSKHVHTSGKEGTPTSVPTPTGGA